MNYCATQHKSRTFSLQSGGLGGVKYFAGARCYIGGLYREATPPFWRSGAKHTTPPNPNSNLDFSVAGGGFLLFPHLGPTKQNSVRTATASIYGS